MSIEFDWVDAFSAQPFGGNGCAVLHNADQLDAARCMKVVRETSLVECTFTGPSDRADIRVRYFVASREIPFAGHPTVATVVAMRHRGLIKDGPLTLETGAGIIPVEVRGDMVRMVQVAPEFGAVVPAEIVAGVYGLPAEAIIHPPQITSTGLPFCITVLRSRADLEAAVLDPAGLRAYFAHLGLDSDDIMEPFLACRTGATAEGDTFARLLLAPPHPPEDPFTGSATGALAAYLWRYGLIDAPDFVAEQGHGLGRPGRAEVSVLGARDAIEGVAVRGQGYVLMSGQMYL